MRMHGENVTHLRTAGARASGLVVQHISGIVVFNTAPTHIWVLLQDGGGNFISSFFAHSRHPRASVHLISRFCFMLIR